MMRIIHIARGQHTDAQRQTDCQIRIYKVEHSESAGIVEQVGFSSVIDSPMTLAAVYNQSECRGLRGDSDEDFATEKITAKQVDSLTKKFFVSKKCYHVVGIRIYFLIFAA